MRKYLVGLFVLLAACPKPATTGADATGASSPRAAVDGFLLAAKAGDLQAMSALWGTEKGPVRQSLSPDELEKRELIMICHLKADDHRIVSETQGQRKEHVLRVALTKNRDTRETTFDTVEGPAGRWYVVNADLQKVQAFCKS